MKYVRIDSRTEVQVPADMPNEEAINRYHLRHDVAPRTINMQHAKRVEENINTIPLLPVEDIEAAIENEELLETE
jgi:hypothetical protein